MSKLVGKGFTPVVTPVLVREEMMIDAGFFPQIEIKFMNSPRMIYFDRHQRSCASGFTQGRSTEESSLPARYVGYSSCFRREAGTYGKDTSGIFGFTSLIRSKCSHSVVRKSHGMNLKCSVK